MICVTLYNEAFEQLMDTFAGIVRNVAELRNISKSRFMNSIGVTIIADGYDRLDETMLVNAENLRMIDRREML